MSNEARAEYGDKAPTGSNVIEIRGEIDELAQKGYVIYQELGGKEENRNGYGTLTFAR